MKNAVESDADKATIRPRRSPLEGFYHKNPKQGALTKKILDAKLGIIDHIEKRNKYLEAKLSKTQGYADTLETFRLPSLGMSISADHISRGKDNVRINRTDRHLLFFLFYRNQKNQDEHFSIEILKKELKKSDGYIKNRITYINQAVKKLVTPYHSNYIGNLITHAFGYGSRLNPRLFHLPHKKITGL